MKKITTHLSVLLILATSLIKAQTPTFFNATGGIPNSIPMTDAATARKTQWFIAPNSLGAVGPNNNITAVYFQAGTNGSDTYPIINLRLKNGTGTSLSGFTGGPIEPGMVLVYSGTNQSIAGTTGNWIKFTLQTPWPYNPSLPLIVELEHNSTNGTGPNLYQTAVSATGPYRQWANYNAATLSGADNVRQINFGIDVVPGCTIGIAAMGVNSSSAICAGSSVTLTTNAVSNYSWSTGATTSSVVISPAVTTAYTLTGTAASNCTAAAVVTIAVNQAVPSLTVTNTSLSSGGICPTKTVNLNASGAQTYTWTGASPTITNGIAFAPMLTATYQVTGENACGTSSAATSVTVHPLPTINMSTSASTICAGSTLSLTASGTGTNYSWYGGAAAITNGNGFTTASTDAYSVIATSALGCTAMASPAVTVYATPALAPTANPALLCLGNSATLTASGASSYTWTNGVQTANTATFLVTPGAQGISTYTVTKANSTCSDTKVISITTNSLPGIFAIASPPTVCALQPSTLSIGGGISYTWTSPGTPNFTFTGANPVVYPAASSDYSVAASDGTCISKTTVSVTANPNPTITTTASSPSICLGQQVTVTAFGGNSYTWTAGTNTFTSQSVTDSPTTAVAYNVTGDNNFGCTATAQEIVLVHPNPPTSATASKPLVCSGGASTLVATGANTYTWDASAGGLVSNTVVVNPMSAVSASIIYTVTGSYAATGCQASKTVAVGVYVPTLGVSGNTIACIGGQISLTANGGNPNSYKWNTGAATVSFPALTTTIAAAAVFTVSATGNSLTVTNCPATRTVAVDVHANPVIIATAERSVICAKEATGLYATGGVNYSWSNSMSGATITVSPLNQTNNYTVTGTDANGCVSTGTVQVKLQSCTGINEQSVKTALRIYPNPSRGEFTVETSSDMELNLVNELGQTVKTILLNSSNDHKVFVSDLSNGIYFFQGRAGDMPVNYKLVVTK